MMIKACIFNKNNNISRFDIFKKFFACIERGAVYQNVLDSDRRMANLTFRLILCF